MASTAFQSLFRASSTQTTESENPRDLSEHVSFCGHALFTSFQCALYASVYFPSALASVKIKAKIITIPTLRVVS
jgi:hypothetical protein